MIDLSQQQPSQTLNTIVLMIIVGLLLWFTIHLIHECSAEDPQCRATHRGHRCVHDTNHPGSHRTEHGRYFSD